MRIDHLHGYRGTLNYHEIVPMHEEKENIRKHALKHRDSLTRDPNDTEQITQLFFETINDLDDKVVAVYWPIKSEIDTSLLIETLLNKDVHICLPKTEKQGEPLTFLSWDGTSPLVDGGWGTKAPEDITSNRVTPNIIIVPIVTFDRNRGRIGYGQGHYDITLHRLKEQGHAPMTIGYAFDQQLCLFSLPKEEHDQTLDMILTPTQCYSPK